MDNIFFYCITDRGLERGMFQAIAYDTKDVFVQKIYSWADELVRNPTKKLNPLHQSVQK